MCDNEVIECSLDIVSHLDSLNREQAESVKKVRSNRHCSFIEIRRVRLKNRWCERQWAQSIACRSFMVHPVRIVSCLIATIDN